MEGLESDASGNNEEGVIELVESPRFALMGVWLTVLCVRSKRLLREANGPRIW